MKLPTVSGGGGPRFLRETGCAAIVGGEDAEVLELEGAADDPPSTETVFLASPSDVAGGELPDVVLNRLRSWGIRALIAPGFEKHLYERSFAVGVLPVIVREDELDQLVRVLRAEPATELTVDLEKQVVLSEQTDPIPFEVDPRLRNKLLLGLGELDEMMRYAEDAETLRKADRARRPWLYEDT